jgi:hypothetical protein
MLNKVHVTTVFLLYILQKKKKKYSMEVECIAKIYYHAEFQDLDEVSLLLIQSYKFVLVL